MRVASSARSATSPPLDGQLLDGTVALVADAETEEVAVAGRDGAEHLEAERSRHPARP